MKKIGNGADYDKLEQRLTNCGPETDSACELDFINNIYVLSMAAFVLQQHNRGVATDTIWPEKLQIFSIGPFTENVCQPMNLRMHAPFQVISEIQPMVAMEKYLPIVAKYSFIEEKPELNIFI